MRSVKNRLKQLEQATAILDSYNLVLIDSEDGATLDIVANRHDGSGELAHVDTIKEFNNFFPWEISGNSPQYCAIRI